MNSSNSPAFFGEWVKKRRKVLDLTQKELAQRSSCTVHTVRKIESGERRPSKQLAELLSNALAISPEEIPTFLRVARGEMNLERLHSATLEIPSPFMAEIQPVYTLSNLPLQITPLVGRDAELTAMEKLFTDPQCRLLTLTGMGGIGKTRLAIVFAERQRSSFQGCVFYIPLTPINSPEAIVPVMADAVGFTFSGPTNPKEQLLNYLASQLSQSVLFVLDNLEHLLFQPAIEEKTGVIGLISELLHRSPNMKVLATSRERLNLQGEWTYELYGLSVPPTGFSGRLDDYSAAAMFVQCARRAMVDFEVTEAEQNAVIHICQMLDGIPLAIELAAAWVGVLSCQEIAQEIDTNIDFLTTSMRDIPERHRSIRASFEHSWKLLSGEEQDVLRKLSVFQGGFDRKAAEQIAGASLMLLASLVSKSLVRRTESGRYDLHEVIRQFASSYLKRDPQSCETYECHCEFYLNYTQAREKQLKSALQQDALRELTGEIDNIRAAWTWAIENDKYEELGRAARAFGWYYEVAGLYSEGIEQLELLAQAVRARPPEDTVCQRILGVTLIQQAVLYFRKGEFQHARYLYEESIQILRLIGDPSLLADAHVFLGVLLHLNGEFERSMANINEGLAYARAGNDKFFEAYAIYNLGYIASLMGRFEEGYEQMLVGLDMWRAVGDPHYIALGLNFLVTTLIELGRHEEAKAFMQESIALCEQTKNRWGLGTAYRHMGLATMSAGQFAEAQIHFHKCLEIYSDYTVGYDIALSLTYLGEAMMMAGDLCGSREIVLDGLRAAAEASITPIIMEALLVLAHIDSGTGEVENSLRILTCVLNNPVCTQKMKDRARELECQIEMQLSEAQIDAVRNSALSQSLEEVVLSLTQ